MGMMTPMSSPAVPSTPVFLVLMATRDGGSWIEEQLQSVLRQQGVELRVCISDDGSTDRTTVLVRDAARRDGRIELLPAVAPSGSACRNFLRLIRSVNIDRDRPVTHVALCDQDDIWYPDKLVRAALRMARDDADLYSSAVVAQWPSGRTKVLLQNCRPTQADHLFEGAGQGCTFVLSRGLFEQLHGFSSKSAGMLSTIHYHDWLIYALARSWNRRWSYDTTPSMVYRQHSANDTGAKGSLTGVSLRVHRIWSGWYRQQVLAVLAACQHASPTHCAASQTRSMITGATTSARQRLRWCKFVLQNSRRRWSERLLLVAFAAFGKL